MSQIYKVRAQINTLTKILKMEYKKIHERLIVNNKKGYHSIHIVLIIAFILNIAIPLILISYVVPTLYKNELYDENRMLIQNNLDSITQDVSDYLLDLQRLATFPYFNEEILEILESKTKQKTGAAQNSIPNTSIERMDAVLQSSFIELLPTIIRLSRDDLLSMVIIARDGSIMYSHRNENVTLNSTYNFEQNSWYKNILSADGNTVFIGAHEPRYFSHSAGITVFSVARVIRHPYIDEPLGIVIADSDTKLIESAFSNFQDQDGYNLIVIDDAGSLIHTSEPIPEEVLDQLLTYAPTISHKGIQYRAYYETVNPSRWRIISLASSEALDKRIRGVYRIGISGGLILILCTIILFRFFAQKSIVKPIQQMISVMKKVEKGDFTVTFKTSIHNELAYLGDNFNAMLANVNHHIEQEYLLVLKQKQAEFQALESQIQPHFLYNTLNGFMGLSKLGKNDILEESISHLNGMLRYTLTPMKNTTIEQECIFIENYCSLQKLRFGKRMEYSVTYDELISNFEIPKLLIQPLVENSIIHGLEPSGKVCSINVKAGVSKELNGQKPEITIIVEDSGVGFDINAYYRAEESIGLHNTRERLRMTFPGSKFKISSTKGKGTTVILEIPIANYAAYVANDYKK